MELPYDRSSKRIEQQPLMDALKAISEHYSNEGTLNDYMRGIAAIRMHEMNSFITNSNTSHVILSREGLRINNRRSMLQTQSALEVYKNAQTNVFRAVLGLAVETDNFFLGAKSADNILRHQRVDSPLVKQTYSSLEAGWKNIQDKGQFVFWDTETFSGKNSFGQMQTDALTEFNFRVVSKKNGEWDLNHKGTPDTLYKSIIGSSQQEYDESIALINRYKAGTHLSENERVKLRRLALTGHADTNIVDNGHGIFNFSSFAKTEAADAMNINDMMRGAERMRNVGIGQEKAPLVSFMGQKMRGWEKAMLQGLSPIFKDGVTAVGHNTAGFDWPTLSTFLARANTTSGFQSALNNLTGGSVLPQYQFDTLAYLRMSGVDRKDLYTNEQWAALKRDKLSAFQQEALAHRYGYDNIYGTGANRLAAHMADTDTYVGSYLITKTNLIEDMGGFKNPTKFGNEIALRGWNKQLFMSTTGSNVADYGLWGFREDAFTGEYRTVDGFAVSKGPQGKLNVRSEIMDQYLFRKEANYTITSIRELTDDTKLRNMLGQLSPDLNRSGLYSVTFNAVVNSGEESYLSRSPVTIVGTRDKIEQYMSSAFYHVADKDKNGNWKLTSDRKTRRDLAVIQIDAEGKKTVPIAANGPSDAKREEAMMQYILDNGTRRMKYEAAGRDARAFDYKKDSGVLSYLTDKEMESTNKRGKYDAKKAKAFDEKVRKRSEELNKKIAAGKNITEKDLAYTYQGYFGFKDKANGWNPKVFTETAAKQLARQGEVSGNSNVYRAAMRRARVRAGLPEVPISAPAGTNYWTSDLGSNKALVSAYYKQYVQAIENAAVEKYGEHAVQNMKNLGTFAYAKNSYEVNLKGYSGITEDKFVRFNLEASGLGYADQILRARGIDSELRGYGDHEKVQELSKFQDWLFKEGRLANTEKALAMEVHNGGEDTLRIRTGSDHVELAAQRLASTFRAERAADAMAGMDKDTFRYDIANEVVNNKNLPAEALDEILRDADQTIPNITIRDKNDIAHAADLVTNEILFGGQDEQQLRKELKEAGYNKRQIDLHLHARSERIKDTKAFMKNFFDAAISNGVNVGYDTEQKKVWLAHQGQTLMLDNLPKDVFENGMFYTEIGATKTASPLGFYDVGGKLEYGSLIRKAAPSKYSMQYIMRRGVVEGNMLGQLEYIGKSFAKSLRESSSVSGLDAQDRKAALNFNWKDVVGHLKDLELDPASLGLNADANAVIQEIIDSSREISTDNINTTQRLSIQMNRSEILAAAARAAGVSDSIRHNVIEMMQHDSKHVGEFISSMDSLNDAFEDSTSYKRGIHNQSSRAIHFNKTAAEKELQGLGVTFGSSITTAGRLHADTTLDGNVGYEVETTARMNRLAASTGAVRDIVNKHASEMDEFTLNMLSSIHTDEGSAALDPRIADRLYSHRETMQKVELNKIYERNPLISNIVKDLEKKPNKVVPFLENKSKAAFNIDFDSNGRVKFSYGNGAYIEEGKEFLATMGSNGDPSSVKSKEVGVLRLGVFSKDGRHLATEEAINDMLSGIKVGKNATQEEVMVAQKAAFDLLNDKYRLSYYIKGLDAATNIKAAEMGREKGMYRSMAASTGAIDGGIRSWLEKNNLSSLKNYTLDIEYIDSLGKKPFSKSIFGVMAAGISNADVSELEKSINQEFGSVEKFRDRLIQERYTPWSILDKSLQAEGIKGVHVISNHTTGEKKHKDAVLFNRVANGLLDYKNMTPEEVKKLFEESGAVTGLEIQNGRLVLGDKYSANIGKMMNIAEKHLGSSIIEAPNGEKMDFARVDVKMLPNIDRGRIYAEDGALDRAIKLNHRAMAVLQSSRISNERLARVEAALGNAAPDEKTAARLKGLLADYKEGDIVAGSAADFIKNHIYTRPGEKNAETVIKLNEDGKFDIKGSKDFAKALEADNMNLDTAQAIADIAAERGANKISRRVIEERFAAHSAAQAVRFNQDGSFADVEALTRRGMNVMRPDELTLPKNGVDAMQFMDSVHHGEFVLDTHIEGLDNQIYDKGSGAGRHIYVPYSPPARMPNGEIAENKVQKILGRIHNMVADFNDRQGGVSNYATMNEQQKQDFFNRYSKTIDELKTEISHSFSGKNGYIANMSRAHLQDSGIFTAYGNSILGGEESKLFKSLEFEGLNLAEQAKKEALEFDYTILSKKAAHKFYDEKAEKIMHELGLEGSADELKKNLHSHLETKGTMAINVREPQGYAKSTSVSATYFSDIVNGDTAIVSAVQHESKKGDYDSDKIEQALLKSEARITASNGKTITRDIDKAMFDTLSKMDGINVEWTDGGKAMNNHAAAILVNAESNRLWSWKNNLLKENMDSYSGSHLATYTIEGSATGTLANRMNLNDKALVDKSQAIYNDLSAQALSEYGDDFNKVSGASDKLGLDLYAHQRRLISEYAQSHNTGHSEQEVRQALHWQLSDSLNRTEAITNSLKGGAGEANYHLFRYLKVAQESNAVGADDFSRIIQVHTALGEAFLSPKNESGFDVRQTEKLSSAFNDAYNAMRGKGDRDAAAKNLADVITGTLEDRADKEMARLPDMLAEGAPEDQATKEMIQRAVNAYTGLIKNVDLRGSDETMYNMAVTKGYASDKALRVDPGSADMIQESLQDTNELARRLGQDAPMNETRGARKLANTAPEAKLLEDRAELKLDAPDIHGNASIGREIAKSIASFDLPKRGGKSGLMSIAGGLLVAGYANTPTMPPPAQTQADGAQSEFQDMYSTSEVPSFSDTGMNSMRGGPGKGYVVNISARTAEGRQVAVDAINSAIGQSMPQTSSINVSMNTSYADKISQFQIDKMVQNSF